MKWTEGLKRLAPVIDQSSLNTGTRFGAYEITGMSFLMFSRPEFRLR